MGWFELNFPQHVSSKDIVDSDCQDVPDNDYDDDRFTTFDEVYDNEREYE